MPISPLQKAIASYIYSNAKKYGINPNTALGIAAYEGLGGSPSANLSGNKDAKGWSVGPYQLYTGPGGGLADVFEKRFGEAPGPNNWQKQVDFSLDQMKNHGYRDWYAVRDQGGIGAITNKGAQWATANGIAPGDFTEIKGDMKDLKSPLPSEQQQPMPNDFLGNLSPQQDGDEPWFSRLGGGLQAAGMALMARDNPEGAAALSRSLGSSRSKQPRQPHYAPAPSGRGFVSIDPTTGSVKYIQLPPDAQKQTDADEALKTEQSRAELELTRARIKATENDQVRNAAKDEREAAKDARKVDAPNFKPADYEKATKLGTSVDTDFNTVEDTNRLQLAIAQGKLKPNWVKGKGWELSAAAGMSPEEGRLYSDYVSTFNRGALRELASQKGAQSEEDAKRIERAIGSGKPVDPRILYDTLGRIGKGAESNYRTSAGELNNMDKVFPGLVGSDNVHTKDVYQNNLRGWDDFRRKTLLPTYESWNKSFDKPAVTGQTKVTSKQEWDNLPSGATAVFPDGSVRRKK